MKIEKNQCEYVFRKQVLKHIIEREMLKYQGIYSLPGARFATAEIRS